MAGEARWPLTRERQALLESLGAMIRRFGAERFLEARLVRADKKDFPDTWEPTLRAVYQVAYRLCWHAYIDPEIAIEDQRGMHDGYGMLRKSEIEIASCGAGVATFHLTSIGNDDVAGLLSHKIGQAFLELAPGEPFRTPGRHEADESEGTVAAVFLGLGVLAANSSMYRRHATQLVGREERSEQEIATAGGLDIADVTLLLAIQDLLRDEVQDALSTLHGPQREWLEDWKDTLDPHEDELRTLLGLDEERPALPLSRPDAPRPAPEVDEGARRRVNAGNEVMRVRDRSIWGLVGGAVLGLIVIGIPGMLLSRPHPLPAALGVLLGSLAGWVFWCQPYYRCTDGRCQALIPKNDKACPRCGGTVTKTITPSELEAYWQQLRAAEDERDEQLDPSEFAGDPDADVLASQRARGPARTRHAR